MDRTPAPTRDYASLTRGWIRFRSCVFIFLERRWTEYFAAVRTLSQTITLENSLSFSFFFGHGVIRKEKKKSSWREWTFVSIDVD